MNLAGTFQNNDTNDVRRAACDVCATGSVPYAIQSEEKICFRGTNLEFLEDNVDFPQNDSVNNCSNYEKDNNAYKCIRCIDGRFLKDDNGTITCETSC